MHVLAQRCGESQGLSCILGGMAICSTAGHAIRLAVQTSVALVLRAVQRVFEITFEITKLVGICPLVIARMSFHIRYKKRNPDMLRPVHLQKTLAPIHGHTYSMQHYAERSSARFNHQSSYASQKARQMALVDRLLGRSSPKHPQPCPLGGGVVAFECVFCGPYIYI